MRYKYLLIVLLILFCRPATAAVFVVTSNADSGPGTLREALTKAAANGSAEKDFINFNLPGISEANRTITVNTQLPDVTGNVIIDGSTQPGAKLGVSDAKVIITVTQPEFNLNAFSIAQSVAPADAVEFYGLYIKDFSVYNGAGGSAIVVNAECMLVIGAPSKGNVISGNKYAVIGSLKNTVIKSNFIGLAPDGVTANDNSIAVANGSGNCDKLTIGGSLPEEGNIIEEAISIYNLSSEAMTIGITNNSFGTDYTGKRDAGAFSSDAYITANAYNTTINITANVFVPKVTAISGSNEVHLIIKGNFMGVDRTGAGTLSGSETEAISLNGHVNALVGGDLPGEENIIANYGSAFFNINFSNLEVIKNSFMCNRLVLTQYVDQYATNYIRIIKLTDNYISGDAPPGAKVQLYYSTETCNGYCNPNKWFATVTANGNGVWEYSGPIKYKVMVSSTVGQQTFGFEPFNILQSDVTITNIDCHHPGAIELNEKREGKFTFAWKNDAHEVIGTGQRIDNLKYGAYTLEISEEGACPTAIGYFNIADLRPHLSPQTVQLDCNTPVVDLSIYDQSYYGIKTYHWEDKDGKPISDKQTLKGVGAGVYYIFITDNNNCNSERVKYEVLPPVDAPVINEANVIFNDSDCGLSNGSITGIKVAGFTTGNYGWATNDYSAVYYNQYDLQGVPAGDYHFFVNYSFNCVVTSKTYTVKTKNSITIDDSKKQVAKATCDFNNGSITGVSATGATIYNWYNSDDQAVSNKRDLDNVAPGSYYLVASNANGCSARSSIYAIEREPRTINGNTKIIKNATCDENNGSITIIFQPPLAQMPKSFRWVNHATGVNIAITAGPQVTGLDAGTYDIYVTHQGCEYQMTSYTVYRDVGLSVITDNIQIEDDHCQIGTGSIRGINANGATPLTFVWTDDNSQVVGNAPNLENVKAGTYHIQITDGSGCTQGLVYTVYDKREVVVPPTVTDLDLCTAGNALLIVNDAAGEYSYRLYDNIDSTTPLNEQQNGRFTVNVPGEKSYYVSKLKGNCESARAEIKVKVGINALNIANSFTPNGDGHNDYWKINGVESNPNAVVQVFNRNGQKLFESKGYATPFNGTYNGKALPVGTYYYIINLNKNCNLLSGSLTILR